MPALFSVRQSASVFALSLACAALANPITPTGQVRTISGHSTASGPGGDFDSGALQADAPDGDYGQWTGLLTVPGVMAGNAAQDGGFNGTDTITLESFSMNLGGGNGPGSSASGDVRDEFTYTFTVGQGATYTFNCNVACAGPGGPPDTTNDWSLVAFLSNAAGDVFRFQTGPEFGYQISVQDVTGTLDAGAYTLSLVGQGAVSFQAIDNGNGQGGGAGGTSPIMTFQVQGGETPVCPADLGAAGGVPGQDGHLDNNDFIAFITYFFNQDPIADMGVAGGLPGHDGQFDNNDFIAFISAFFAGC